RRVKVWVGYLNHGPRQVVLNAMDATGAVVATVAATLGPVRGFIPIQTPLEVAVAGNTIRSATVGFADGANNFNNGLGVDDVEFEQGTPAGATNPTSTDFSAQTIGTSSGPRAITLVSTGSAPLTVKLTHFSAQTPDFSITNDGCTGKALAPQAQCAV